MRSTPYYYLRLSLLLVYLILNSSFNQEGIKQRILSVDAAFVHQVTRSIPSSSNYILNIKNDQTFGQIPTVYNDLGNGCTHPTTSSRGVIRLNMDTKKPNDGKDSMEDDNDNGISNDANRIEANDGTSNTFFIEEEDCYDLCDTELFNPEEEEEFRVQASPSSIQENVKKNQHITASTTSTDDEEDEEILDSKSLHHAMENLELRWDIDTDNQECDIEDITTCSEPCPTCSGTGKVECPFCGGSGYIDFGKPSPGTVGETLANKNGGFTGAECPVCDENGEVDCSSCKGSGWIARWRIKKEHGGLEP